MGKRICSTGINCNFTWVIRVLQFVLRFNIPPMDFRRDSRRMFSNVHFVLLYGGDQDK